MTLLTQEQFDSLADELENIHKVQFPRLKQQAWDAMNIGDIEAIKAATIEQRALNKRIQEISKVLEVDLKASEMEGVT